MPHAPSLPHRSPQPAPGPTTPPTDVVVEARDLTKVYGSGEARVAALDGVSLTVSRGQFVAVMGPSGSGKSTLLHCLAGLDTPASGHVLIAGRDLAGMNDKQLTAVRRDQLGFVFQAFNLLPTRLAHRTPDPNWQNAVIAALGIGDRLTHRPAELSGGQQQRVAIARALIGRPQVVFADEPTGALDTASAASLLQALARMCDNLGQTVVMVTHDENAAAATNRVIRLRDGRIIGDDAVRRPTSTHAAAAPARPAGAAAPAGTAGTAAPAGWVTPAGPAAPTDPATPAAPTGTAGTAAPAGWVTPAGPATPTDPATSATPTGTAGTAAPVGPAGPATPAGPTAPTGTGTTASTAATGREAR